MPRDESTVTRSPAGAGPINWPAELERHGRWLRTVALARVGDAAAADDVMQEVAASSIEKGHQLRDAKSVAAWLYRLVVVAALQYRRRQGRRRKLVERYAARFTPSDSDSSEPDPLDWLLTDERKRMVRQALAQLPRRDAEILLLKYSEDWSYRQLAEHLGLSHSAVEARLHRAREKLRRELHRMDPSLSTAQNY
jgi:RNA polymerase sigma factor (sigma-70 family)